MAAPTQSPSVLHAHHLHQLLVGSAIPQDLVDERGYQTVTKKKDLKLKGFSQAQQDTLDATKGNYGWLARTHFPGSASVVWVYRPDDPRIKKSKPIKYEMASGSRMALDSPPRCHVDLGDPNIPLLIPEGLKKGDSGAARGGCWVSPIGVWNWRGKNLQGGKAILADWEHVALNRRKVYLVFDSDILEKMPVYQALARLREWLKSKGADVWIVYLPSKTTGEKMGVDDWFAEDPSRTLDDLLKLARKDLIKPALDPSETELRRVETVLPGAPVAAGLVVPLGYELGAGGVAQLKLDRRSEDALEERRISIAPEPIYIAGRLENIFTDEQWFVLVYRQGSRWVRKVVERSVAMDARKLVSLSGHGFPTTSGRAGGVVEYLADFESANIKYLPLSRTTPQLGFQQASPGDDSRGYLWGEKMLKDKGD